MTEEHRAQVRQGVQSARTGWRNAWREILWFFGALDDKGNPSAAMFFAVAVGISQLRHLWRMPPDDDVSVVDVVFIGLILAALFGRSMFAKWLAAKEATASVQEVVVTDTAKVIEAIRARRESAASESAEAAP